MKLKLSKLAAMLLLSAALPALTSCSSTSEDENVQAGSMVDSVSVTVIVDSINAAERSVVLRRADGSKATYVCGPEIRNFDQIKAGDLVKVTIAEETALLLVKGGMDLAAAQASAVVRAPLGAKPSGKVVETIGLTAKVMSVDTAKRQVSLQLVDGQTRTVKVGPDINLDNIKPGDDVGVRLTQAVAVSVEKP